MSCHIIGHIPASASNAIELRYRKLITSTVLTYSRDAYLEVRAASCGTIGALSHHAWVRADIETLSTFADKLPALCDDINLKVRIRAFWALGTLIDAFKTRKSSSLQSSASLFGGLNSVELLTNDSSSYISPDFEFSLDYTHHTPLVDVLKEIPEIDISSDLSIDLKMKMLHSAMAGCSDQEKVRPHAFRSLGRIIDMIPKIDLDSMVVKLEVAVRSIVSNLNSGAVKNRWNACHCLKSLLHYSGFPIGVEILYSDIIFKSLVEVSSSSSNFKVKTGAILALATPEDLERYGTNVMKPLETIAFILTGLKITVLSIDKIITRATNEEQNYLFQFLDALRSLLEHVQVVCGDQWNQDMVVLERSVLKALTTAGKQVSRFDPKGK
jgi:hypothetical protein